MEQTLTIRDQSCPNPSCTSFEEKGGKNVSIHSQKFKRVQCKLCRKTWVIHLRETHYRLRRTKEDVENAIQLLQKGLSLRQVSRRLQASPKTIHRWKNKYKSNPQTHS